MTMILKNTILKNRITHSFYPKQLLKLVIQKIKRNIFTLDYRKFLHYIHEIQFKY